MQKIESNIDIINKVLYENYKNILFVTKWMRIEFKLFVENFNQYLRWIYSNSIELKVKTKSKIERIKNNKELIEVYFEINKGR